MITVSNQNNGRLMEIPKCCFISFSAVLYKKPVSMMAKRKELESLLKTGAIPGDNSQLKDLLRSTKPDVRADVLITVNQQCDQMAACNSAFWNDLQLLECMLDDLSCDQKYKIVSMQISDLKYTPLHYPSMSGHTGAVKYLLCKLAEEQIFQILKAQDCQGNTAIHKAAAENHSEIVEYLLESVATERQTQLFSIQNNDKLTVGDVLPECLLLKFPSAIFKGNPKF